MLYWLLVTVYVVVCLLLLLAVLLQQGKGGDIAAAFGGGGGQAAFGARQGAAVLTKASAVLGALFMLGALGLAIVGTRGPSSVMSGVASPRPAQTTPAAPTPPTNPSATSNPAPTETPVAPGMLRTTFSTSSALRWRSASESPKILTPTWARMPV